MSSPSSSLTGAPVVRRPSSPLPDVDEGLLRGAGVLVTGAGHGIGREIVRRLARAGASVAAADIAPGAAAACVNELEGPPGLAVEVDVAHPGQASHAVEQAVAAFGRLDVLVNSAGVVHVDRLTELDIETWRRVFRVNVEGTFLMTQAAVATMRAQRVDDRLRRRGLVLSLSSRAAAFGRPYLAAYGASKAAVNHLAKSSAMAFEAYDISTVVVYPGDVREGMWGDLGRRLADVAGKTVDEVEGERSFQPVGEFAEVVCRAVAVPGMELNGALVLESGDRTTL